MDSRTLSALEVRMMGGDSDHFRVLVGDQVADDGLVALFLHIIEQAVGIRPVFRGEGENVQFDLQQVAEILGNDGQGLETKQREFGSGILCQLDAAQNVVVADSNVDNGDVNCLGNHVGGVRAGDDDVILVTVAFRDGESLFHTSGKRCQFNFMVLYGTVVHEGNEPFIGSNSKNADFFHNHGLRVLQS